MLRDPYLIHEFHVAHFTQNAQQRPSKLLGRHLSEGGEDGFGVMFSPSFKLGGEVPVSRLDRQVAGDGERDVDAHVTSTNRGDDEAQGDGQCSALVKDPHDDRLAGEWIFVQFICRFSLEPTSESSFEPSLLVHSPFAEYCYSVHALIFPKIYIWLRSMSIDPPFHPKYRSHGSAKS